MTLSGSPLSGAFILDSHLHHNSSSTCKLDFPTRSHLYRTPQAPSSASSFYRSANPNEGSRKRIKHGGFDSACTNENGLDDQINWASQSASFSDLGSPTMLANTNYRLAGGIDQPVNPKFGLGGQVSGVSDAAELDYRPSRYRGDGLGSYEGTNLGKRTRRDDTLSQEDISSCNNNNNNNNHGGNNVASFSSPGWGKAMINMVGGVAFKFWDFCWSAPFRGFYAGGGRGYQMKTQSRPSLDDSGWQDVAAGSHNVPSNPPRVQTPLPGQFPEDGQLAPLQGRDDLRANWVLVKKDQGHLAEGASLESPSARKSQRRNSAVPSIATPRRTTTTGRPARRSTLSSGRPSTSNRSHAPHTGYHNNNCRHASSKDNNGPTKPESPASVEAQRYAAKARKREREEDASIRRLNQQLKTMIKEGKEALGTKIEIDEDEGMEDWD